MEFYLSSLSEKPYRLTDPGAIRTPALLVFRDRLEANLSRMKELLRKRDPGFTLDRLWPHAKTHKSLWVTQKLLPAGIRSFKSTPNEVEMLVQAGVEAIFVAYPLLPEEARRVAALASSHPSITFYVQVGKPEHFEALRQAAGGHRVRLSYLLDLDVGMHRTGIPPEDAWPFFASLPETELLPFAGLHAYDGHINSSNPSERSRQAESAMARLLKCAREFAGNGRPVSRLVVGGTPSFLEDLQILRRGTPDAEIILSPGTWVYFDSKSALLLPDTFEVAACILARVIDRTGPDKATLNLGHKRWAVDSGPLDCFSIAGMEALSWSEEHTLVRVPPGEALSIGEYVLFAPRHVCSTVNLWESFIVIGPGGEVELPDCPIEARNR